MASWAQIEREAPEFGGRVRDRFAAGTNKTIATPRRDGSPRISAIEVAFHDGEVTMGMMGGSLNCSTCARGRSPTWVSRPMTW